MPPVRAVLVAGMALLALAMGLAATVPTASAQGATTATTTLRPGLNLAGWTEAEADATALFKAIPRLDMAYAWDADVQRFRWAARDGSGDLRTLTPGMGLWLALGGAEPFIWTRSMLPPGGIGLVPLREGWNFVAWSGRDGIAPGDAFRGIDGVLTEAWGWDAQTQRRGYYVPGVRARGNALSTLYNGSAYWLRVSGAKHWWQFPPRVEFPSDVTPARQTELRTLVDGVVSFFIERTGIAVPGLTVRFDADRPELCGGGYDGRMRVIKVDCFRPLAHEYTHAIQSYLRSHDQSGQPRGYAGPRVPVWITEGMANHWSGVYHASTGDRPLDTYFAGTIFPEARRTSAPLRSIEIPDNFHSGDRSAHHSLAYLSIEYLIDLTSEDDLFTYYRRIISGNSWMSTFQSIFDLDVEQFYRMFETHRTRTFPPYGWISGTVLGPDDEPLENVYVRAHVGANRVRRGPTQADGAFRISVEPGSYAVSFTDVPPYYCHLGWYDGDGELTSRRAEAVLVTAGIVDVSRIVIHLPATPAELTTELCPPIRGTVLGLGGEPLENVRVRGDRVGPNGRTWQAVTGPDGAFEYLAEPGAYIVALTDLEPDECHFGWYDLDGELTSRREEALVVTVGDAGVNVQGIVIRLSATPTEICPRVSGTVLGPGGKPLQDVRVRGDREGATGRTWQAVTGPDGAFAYPVEPGAYIISFTSLPPDDCHFGWYDGGDLTARGEEAVLVTVGDAGVEGINIRLSATPDDLASTLCARVEGVVQGRDGEPLSGIQVNLYRRDRLHEGIATDSDGAFSVIVPDGSYKLSLTVHPCHLGVYDDSGARLQGGGHAVTVADAVDVTGIVIQFSQPLSELCQR